MIGATVSGTLTRETPGGTLAAGTLSVTGYATDPAAGTLSVDRTLSLAFAARVRLTRPDVFINGELMKNLVETVEIDTSLADPIDYATFTLSDKRVAYFDAASVSHGERTVAVDLWAGPPGGVTQWHAFIGSTETSQNTMPYRPRGVFKTVNGAAKWADNKGCINIPAFGGFTRGQILVAFAATAGIYIENGASLKGGVVNRPVDLADITPYELIQRYGEVEGWFARTTLDGLGLEVINEDEVLKGNPCFYFDESNTFDVPETTPDRPVTEWILSATQVLPAPGADGNVPERYQTTITDDATTDGEGRPMDTITEIHTDTGVEVKRIVTMSGMVFIGGSWVSQNLSEVTTENNWEMMTYTMANGCTNIRPSSQLNSRRTTTWLRMGIPCDTSGYLWSTGGYFTEPEAGTHWHLAEIIDETYTWDAATCTQSTSLSVVQQNYSPLFPCHSGGYPYGDGSCRADSIYTFREVSRDSMSYGYNLNTNMFDRLITFHSQWYSDVPGHEIYGYYATSTQTTQANNSNTAFTIQTTVNTIFGDSTASAQTLAAVPPANTGSSTTANFQQQTIVEDYDATGASGYTRISSSPGAIDYAENVADLKSIAKRRIRRALCDQIDIPHNLVPFLRPGDHVAITNHARSLINADAYITAIKRTADVTNGAMRQVTTVMIPPDWI